jgi:hypothetical protein
MMIINHIVLHPMHLANDNGQNAIVAGIVEDCSVTWQYYRCMCILFADNDCWPPMILTLLPWVCARVTRESFTQHALSYPGLGSQCAHAPSSSPSWRLLLHWNIAQWSLLCWCIGLLLLMCTTYVASIIFTHSSFWQYCCPFEQLSRTGSQDSLSAFLRWRVSRVASWFNAHLYIVEKCIDSTRSTRYQVVPVLRHSFKRCTAIRIPVACDHDTYMASHILVLTLEVLPYCTGVTVLKRARTKSIQ